MAVMEFRCGCGRRFAVNINEVSTFGDHIPGAETLPARKDWKPEGAFMGRGGIQPCEIEYKPLDKLDELGAQIANTAAMLRKLEAEIKRAKNT